jgi:hypothetical protein
VNECARSWRAVHGEIILVVRRVALDDVQRGAYALGEQR